VIGRKSWDASSNADIGERGYYVRFGSKADMCDAKGHVRFTPNSDRESRFPQKIMSALPPKADMCSAAVHVRFGPKADICHKIKRGPPI
jgi:hypothetical protein